MNEKMVMRSGQTVSDPFPIDGKAYILASMPQGETWANDRTLKLQYKSPHEGDEDDWRDVNIIETSVNVPNNNRQDIRVVKHSFNIEWTGGDNGTKEGFEYVEGVYGILYRLVGSSAGCNASLHYVRNYESSKPGR